MGAAGPVWRNRRRLWLSVAWDTVPHPDGSAAAFVGTVRDVSAEHLAAQRDAVVARLTERLAEVSDVRGGQRSTRSAPPGSPTASSATVLWSHPGRRWRVPRSSLAQSAAGVMGQLRTACRTLLLEDHTAPQVLTAMDQVAVLIPDACCTTVFCATIDRVTGAFRYSCAGHSPAIVARANGRTELLDGARSVPLATVDVARPEATTILVPGDTVLLYTDGLVERRGRSLDAGIACARGLLAQTQHLAPTAIAERLAEELLGAGHDDDVAYLREFHATASASGAVTVIAIGEIDLATAGQFRDSLAQAGAGSDLITIDLTAANYVDSAGIRVLYEFAASHTLELLVHPSTVPAAALAVSGLVDVVTVRNQSTDPIGEGDAPR